MEKYLTILKSLELFDGIESQDLLSLLSCLAAKLIHVQKNETVLASGENSGSFGIVLAGQVQVYQDDYYGNRSIFANIGPGHLFGESFACAQSVLPVSAVASTDADLLMIDCRRLSKPCCHACAFHGRLIHNMLGIIARKNIMLTQKIEFTSKRTTREKLLAYLSVQAQAAQSRRFRIPFDRQGLADFLSVDRSGLSAELGKLRDEGILRYHKNEFELAADEK